MTPLTLGSLFAGIGGFELGLERTSGFRTEWQVEIDPYCQRVLAKHWPDVRRWGDVRTFPPEGNWHVDVICGGFPCQDISNAGSRAGIKGTKSGEWSEFARIIRLLRPRFVLVENVAAILARGIGRVLGDLAEFGYDAEWDCIPAAAVGALHVRNRLYLLAYQASDLHDTIGGRYRASKETVFTGRRSLELSSKWAIEPQLDRVANGVPNQTHRLRALGNAVVPQCAEFIGRQLLDALKEN